MAGVVTMVDNGKGEAGYLTITTIIVIIIIIILIIVTIVTIIIRSIPTGGNSLSGEPPVRG